MWRIKKKKEKKSTGRTGQNTIYKIRFIGDILQTSLSLMHSIVPFSNKDNICIHTCIYEYIYINTYTYMYTHTYICINI